MYIYDPTRAGLAGQLRPAAPSRLGLRVWAISVLRFWISDGLTQA